jgi:hypothetical protein
MLYIKYQDNHYFYSDQWLKQKLPFSVKIAGLNLPSGKGNAPPVNNGTPLQKRSFKRPKKLAGIFHKQIHPLQ